MVSGGCLPKRWSGRMPWRYDEDKCRVLVEIYKRVLFECTFYGDERGRLTGAVGI